MAWNNANELVVGNGGQVYVAPVGTALPTTTTGALNAAFVGLGFVNEDGVTLTVGVETEEFFAWQVRDPVRRELIRQTKSAAFALEQWNESTLPFAYGGGSISGTTPNYHYAFPDDSASIDERALVLDVNDGSEHHRFTFPRVTVSEDVESSFKRNELALLPITVQALAPAAGGSACDYYTDSAGFLAGS